ncbi:hypothetical protein BDZ89DRAFT_1035288 [Hymenopellis radicata]|nr:hypothetical protein BDZ89DRAFT_1035288 [Hymenopellis radicata]
MVKRPHSPLPGCQHVNDFEAARVLVWPDTPSSEIIEPVGLTKIIQSYALDEQWLTVNGDRDSEVSMSEPPDADEPIGEPADTDDVGDNPPKVRYIDLSEQPALLAFKWLGPEVTIHQKKATFIVRDEYKEFIEHALSQGRLSRTFVTGQPGIGKSFGAVYFLMYLFGLGKSVFWVQDDFTYYFDSHGVQRLLDPKAVPTSEKFRRALMDSWVLIDMDQDAMPSTTYKFAPYVIWTSSPRDLRWRYFTKHFWPCARWFMKAWSAKEIMAAADKLGSGHDDVMARMAWYGPVARSLFHRAPPTEQDVSNDIRCALSGNPFAVDAHDGTQPVHAVFLVMPAKDDGGHCLVREKFYAKFLTPAVAEMTFELAENRMEQLQLHLSGAFDIPSTRGVAGKLVEGLMFRSLSRGMRLPDIFGGGVVAATDVFTPQGNLKTGRPLYLRLLLPSFAAVDAMIVLSDGRLVLLQTSLNTAHSKDFGMMLRIISRLLKGAGVHVSGDILYCVVGSSAFRVRNLARTAANTLTQLQDLARRSAKEFSTEVGVSTDIARQRIHHFRVVGVTFDHQVGFNNVDLSASWAGSACFACILRWAANTVGVLSNTTGIFKQNVDLSGSTQADALEELAADETNNLTPKQ